MITITVCLPVFNGGTTLGETLQSLQDQQYQGWQLVAVNDGSSDETISLLHRFKRSHEGRVKVVEHEENKGLAEARNTALEFIRSTHVAFLDADDLWEPEHLEVCLKNLQESQSNWVFSSAVLFGKFLEGEPKVRAPKGKELEQLPVSLFKRNFILPSATAISRENLHIAGKFDPRFRYCEDWDLWLRLLKHGVVPEFTGLKTVRHRKHSGALTANLAGMAEGKWKLYDKHRNWGKIPLWMRYYYLWKFYRRFQNYR